MNKFREFLEAGLTVGKYSITVLDLVVVAGIFVLAQVLLRLGRLFLNRSMVKRKVDLGKQFMIRRMWRTLVYLVAGMSALSTIGVEMKVLFAGSAALLVGVGIGLQSFFNDVVSGFVLLFEGGVRVGDELEVDGSVVRVERIDLRSTRVVTRSGDLIVLPNGMFSGQSVRNFTQGRDRTRLDVRVGVAYGSDTALVSDLLIQAMRAQPEVGPDEEIVVVFQDFGDSALVFEVRSWIRSPWTIDRIKSDIRFRIDGLFRQHRVVVPFPQRDVRLIQPS
jgi:small-conductance mechanosensitive channel